MISCMAPITLHNKIILFVSVALLIKPQLNATEFVAFFIIVCFYSFQKAVL